MKRAVRGKAKTGTIVNSLPNEKLVDIPVSTAGGVSEIDISQAIAEALSNTSPDLSTVPRTVTPPVQAATAVTTAPAQPANAPPVKLKKAVGRPKINKLKMPVEIKGIIKAPVNPEDSMLEIVYRNPTMFKKIIQLYKAFTVDEVEMNFDPTGLRMVTDDHLMKSTIYTMVDGDCMDLYFCKEPIRIVVKRDDLETVFGSITKTHYKIMFVLGDNWRSELSIILKDHAYDNDLYFTVPTVTSMATKKTRVEDNDSNYPLVFTYTSNFFKAEVSRIARIANHLRIEKIGNEPLRFTCDKSSKVNVTSVYNSNAKLNLQSKLGEADILSVGVFIDHIDPLANSRTGENITIAVDKTKRISFTTHLDICTNGLPTTIIKVYTELRGPGVASTYAGAALVNANTPIKDPAHLGKTADEIARLEEIKWLSL